MNSEIRKCQNCKKEFRIEPEDFAFYEKMKVPPPTWCPECRMIRRMAWFGYRHLYKRTCDFTGKEILSFLHPSVPNKVYRQDVWWSDKWDPKEYGREYDFQRSFFEQFHELLQAVPIPSLRTEYTTMIQSEYCNAAANCKDCYLCFKTDRAENSAYTNTITDIKDSFDISFSNFCELCYEGVRLWKTFKVFDSEECNDSHDILFSRDLSGCANCIGCVNLRSNSYHIFNQPYTKEAYEREIEKLDLGSYIKREEFKKRAEDFFLTQPRRAFQGVNNTDVSGDYIFNSRDVHDSWMVQGEHIRYSHMLTGHNAYSYDYTIFGTNAEWIYESCWVGINVSNIKFGLWNYNANHLEYSLGCHGSHDLFGCIGIRKGEYCILNTRYAKEEYQRIVADIKKQMQVVPYRDALGREYRYGEFFPVELSPQAYNETTAQEFFPLTKEEAIRQGFRWHDPDEREYQEATMEIPDHIRDVGDEILKAILKCEECGRNYQIIKMELEFYRTHTIPIPRKCPLCRDRTRTAKLNPIRIYNRTCAKCGKAIQTSYAPDRPEIVYCEQCYQQEVV